MKCGLSLNILLLTIENESAFHEQFWSHRRNGLSLWQIYVAESAPKTAHSLSSTWLSNPLSSINVIHYNVAFIVTRGRAGPDPTIKEGRLFVCYPSLGIIDTGYSISEEIYTKHTLSMEYRLVPRCEDKMCGWWWHCSNWCLEFLFKSCLCELVIMGCTQKDLQIARSI